MTYLEPYRSEALTMHDDVSERGTYEPQPVPHDRVEYFAGLVVVRP